MIEIEGYLSYGQAAERLGLSAETVRKYARRGLLKRDYIETLPLVCEKSVEHYSQHRQPPGNPTFRR